MVVITITVPSRIIPPSVSLTIILWRLLLRTRLNEEYKKKNSSSHISALKKLYYPFTVDGWINLGSHRGSVQSGLAIECQLWTRNSVEFFSTVHLLFKFAVDQMEERARNHSANDDYSFVVLKS